MIDSISLENWKTHRQTTLHFRKGTNVLVGVIGSGKSSVMDALCYGLFGTFPALQNRRVSTNDLFMRKPFPSDTAKISVSFGIGDKKYRVERILKRTGANEGRLYRGDTLLAGPKPNQVTERIEQELQVSYELFSRAVYSEQNQVDYFLKLNPGERKKKFDELLDLQKYEVVRSNANTLMNHFKKSQEGLRQSLSHLDALLGNEDVNALRFKIESQKQKRQSLELILSKKKEEKAVLESRLIELKRRVQERESIEHELHSLRGKSQSIKSQLDFFSQSNPSWDAHSLEKLLVEKSSTIDRLAFLIRQQEQHRLLEIQHQKALQRLELAEKRHAEWSSRTKGETIDKVENMLHQLKNQKKQLVEKQLFLQKELAECVSILHLSQTQLNELDKEESNVRSLHAHCPTCRQEIQPQHVALILESVVEKKNFFLLQEEAAEARRRSLVGEESGVLTVLRGIDSAISEQESVLLRLQDGQTILDDVSRARAESQSAEKNILSLSLVSVEELDALRTRLHFFTRAEEMFRMKKEWNRVTDAIASREKLMDSFSHVKEEWDGCHAEWSRFEFEWKSLQNEHSMLVQMENELSSRLKNIDSMLAKRKELESALLLRADVEEGLGVFSRALVETQQQLREGVVEAINAALVELWPSLYPYRDFTLAKVLIQENDYVLTVRERSGNWVSAESSLSGGERSAAALALRMAIAFVLTRQLSWIILDEPTHNLDAKSIQSLSSMLRDRLPGLVDQVFVITHSPDIEKSATGSLYVLEREKNEDGVTNPINHVIDLGTRIS
ncbi:MAG: SMC family ATPase [Candidatus Diapherotrites archaeon]